MSPSGIVTYSPAYTVVPTYECFNRCDYCNFRADPGQTWLSLEAAAAQLKPLQTQATLSSTAAEAMTQEIPLGVIEVLILSGEVHPQSPRRQGWFQRVYDLCELALSLGFLPHTNVGPLSFAEMAQLKTVNVSMGLMLEQLTPDLLKVHRHAPSKIPEVRLQQLAWAGELQIPFTTGLLLGIGETETDWYQTLAAIANLHNQWGHIQEVILQPHSPGHQQTWIGPGFPIEKLPEVVATARRVLPPEITLQIPPNLIDSSDLLIACLEAGARDLGGIGPYDHVNPNYPHPRAQILADQLAQLGWQLRPRLPVYDQYDAWLPTQLQQPIQQWRQYLLSLVPFS